MNCDTVPASANLWETPKRNNLSEVTQFGARGLFLWMLKLIMLVMNSKEVGMTLGKGILFDPSVTSKGLSVIAATGGISLFLLNLIIYFILSVIGTLLCLGAFSSCSKWDLLSNCSAWASCNGFSCCRAWALGHAGVSSCGAQA